MFASCRARIARFALGIALAAAPLAPAAQAAPDYEPHVGQDGKDVVWVPTPQALVDRMLDMAQLAPGDFLVDLGSGDGRTVITAARRGARALGIEYNADLVALARHNARAAGVAGRAEFRQADLYQTDLSQATVITLFLLPEINVKLRPRLLKLAPGTRIVSNTFRMGDWKPDASALAHRDCDDYCRAYLWIVPARAAGTWDMPQGTLTLKQRFQYVSGQVQGPDAAAPVTRGKIAGDTLRFIAGGTEYAGRIAGGTITGTATTQGRAVPWTAQRR